MTEHMGHPPGPLVPPGIWLALLGVLALLYALGLAAQPRGKRWPVGLALCWYAGVVVAGLALVGPLADRAHMDFAWHMAGHLLLGMLAPIGLVLGAPVTLLLRALPPAQARRLVRILALPPLRVLAHPVPAAVLDMGGLVVLYATGLYGAMHARPALFVLVHLHVLLAGYLFTAALIGRDPLPHRPSWLFRAGVLVLALGAHAILAKWLYAHPPAGVPAAQAERGALLMYYGGDAVDLLLIVLFCRQWYVATRPRGVPGAPAILPAGDSSRAEDRTTA